MAHWMAASKGRLKAAGMAGWLAAPLVGSLDVKKVDW